LLQADSTFDVFTVFVSYPLLYEQPEQYRKREP